MGERYTSGRKYSGCVWEYGAIPFNSQSTVNRSLGWEAYRMASDQSLERSAARGGTSIQYDACWLGPFGSTGSGSTPENGRSQPSTNILKNGHARYHTTPSKWHLQKRCPRSEKVTLDGASPVSHVTKHVHFDNLTIVPSPISCERSAYPLRRFVKRRSGERKTGFWDGV